MAQSAGPLRSGLKSMGPIQGCKSIYTQLGFPFWKTTCAHDLCTTKSSQHHKPDSV